MHDSGDLPDHHGSDAVPVEGFEQRERIESEGVVRADRAGLVVDHLQDVTPAAPTAHPNIPTR
ncbi:hypothetical protein ACWEPN_17810 [Nonomuraea wenchangensis]